MESFDWSAFFNIILSLITFGAVGNIVFHKYRSKTERLKPEREDVDISSITRKSAEEAMDEVGKWHDKVTELYEKSSEMKKEISDLKYMMGEQDRKIAGVQDTLKRQIGRKKFAEKHICTVIDCTLRQPPLGAFASDDDDMEKYVRLNQNIKKND